MSATYYTDAMLVPASVTDNRHRIDALNDELEAAGLNRPIGQPEPAADVEFVRVPVDLDPIAIRDAVRSLNLGRGTALLEPKPEFQFRVATVHEKVRHRKFGAAGVKHGHGHAAVSWLTPNQLPDEIAHPAARRAESSLPGGRRPVIALLDNGVDADHHFLVNGVTDGDPFCIDAESEGWKVSAELRAPATPTIPLDPQDQGTDDLGKNFGSHYGHATFIAGLIRLAAPDSRVLSIRVMNDDGEASDANVAAALKWLAGRQSEHPVDVVCMAFGRQADADRPKIADPEMQEVREAFDLLAGLGVPLVVSAGNDGDELPMTFPAGWSLELSQILSVGAGTPRDPAKFSNRGNWVNTWQAGEDVVSSMPLVPRADLVNPEAGFATWSGTSFSAGTQAGLLAAAIADGVAGPVVR